MPLCLDLSCYAVLVLMLYPETTWCASALFAKTVAPVPLLSRCAWAGPCCLAPLLTSDMLLLQNGVIFVDRDGRHFAE